MGMFCCVLGNSCSFWIVLPDVFLIDRLRVDQDLDTEFHLPKTTFIGGKDKTLPLREIISR
jgi:hypothetical protein